MPFLGKTPSQIVDPEVDIDGGTIDGVSIGSVTANAGAFTNLTATGTLTLPDDGISGDDVNGGTISNFASTGIDDNATSTAITIDAAGNLGLGTTNPFGELSVRSASPQIYLEAPSSGNVQINFNETADQLDVMVNNSAGKIAFGTASIERMRIDSSGNVLFNTTNTLTSAELTAGETGIAHRSGDLIIVSRDGGAGLLVNRKTSDGELIDFRKNGTVVGSIGTTGGQIHLDGASGDIGLYMGTNNLYPRKSGAITDNAVDLGQSSYRFRNLYMAGDAVMGASNNIIYQSGTTFNVRAAVADLTFQTNGANERMRIDSSGLVGINTENPSTFLEVAHATTGVANTITTYNSNTAASAECAVDWALNRTGSEAKIRAARITAGKEQTWTTTASTVDGYLKFLTVRDESLNEAMRIDSSGRLLVGTLSNSFHTLESNNSGNYAAGVTNSNPSAPYGLIVYLSGVTGGNGGGFLTCVDNGNRLLIRGSGSVENATNSYGAFSDARLKSNIVDASSQIDDIMAVQVRSYTLNDTGDTHIGVVAQELEASGMSGLVTTDDEGMKSVKYSVLYMKAIKALQEAVTRIETLEAEVAALKGE